MVILFVELQSCSGSVPPTMTEEIDGYKDDLERQIATLRENLTKLDKAKDDRRGNVRAVPALYCVLTCQCARNSSVYAP